MSLPKGLWGRALVLGALLAITLACGGPTAQAKSCPGAAGAGADEALLAQQFSRMEFGGGGAGTGEGGQEFGPSESVVVVAIAATATETRFCAQERSRLGTVVYDQSHTLPVGESRIDLGPIATRGSYVVRVSVGGALVKNLTFTAR